MDKEQLKTKQLQQVERKIPIEVTVLSPQGEEPRKLTEDDVWGTRSADKTRRLDRGMIVARYNEKCPHFNDTVPFKSVTVVCKESQFNEVEYWLEYVYGYGCISKTKQLDEGLIAIRADYQAW